jgi:hypothetical protein
LKQIITVLKIDTSFYENTRNKTFMRVYYRIGQNYKENHFSCLPRDEIINILTYKLIFLFLYEFQNAFTHLTKKQN